ncbi:MAG: polysaccharide biosynthesis tyrosine autokinase [Candidatus Omnitrophica bacterium]|nr:polysaccharide biosynthesis tyrosine autokinase [Candidatus Omnitrophota bacterium]
MDSKRTSFRDILEIFCRRRRIVQVFFSVVLVTTLAASVLMPPKHEASTTILIEVVDRSPFFRNPYTSEMMLEWVKAQAEVIKSYTVLGEVVDALQLDKAFKEEYMQKEYAKQKTKSTTSHILNGINIIIPNMLVPKNIIKRMTHDEFHEKTDFYFRQTAIKFLQKNIKIIPLEDTGIIKIQATTKGDSVDDASRASKIANLVTDTYIDEFFKFQKTEAGEARKFVDDKLENAHLALLDSEEALKQFIKSENIVSLTEEKSIATEELADLNTQYYSTEADLQELRAILAKLDTEQNLEAIYSIREVSDDSFVDELKRSLAAQESELSLVLGSFTEESVSASRIKEAIKNNRVKLIEESRKIIQANLKRLERKKDSLAEIIGNYKVKLSTFSDKEIRLGQLRREVENNKERYSFLLQEQQKLSISEALGEDKIPVIKNVKVLDYASVPIKPAGPNLALNLTLGCLLGFVFSAGGVFVSEYWDTSLKGKDDIGHYLGLSMVGIVPQFNRNLSRIAANTKIDPAYDKLIAGLSLNKGEPLISIITSAKPGEGKTTTASFLGAALANGGKRVLLIDANLRKPALHKIFGLKQSPGLVESLLLDNENLNSCINPTHSENLKVVTSGNLTGINPGGILQSDKMNQFIHQLKKNFDVILFDSPSGNEYSDAAILNKLVRDVLVVAEAYKVRYEVVSYLKERLEKNGASIIGVILNKRKFYIPEILYRTLL